MPDYKANFKKSWFRRKPMEVKFRRKIYWLFIMVNLNISKTGRKSIDIFLLNLTIYQIVMVKWRKLIKMMKMMKKWWKWWKNHENWKKLMKKALFDEYYRYLAKFEKIDEKGPFWSNFQDWAKFWKFMNDWKCSKNVTVLTPRDKVL